MPYGDPDPNPVAVAPHAQVPSAITTAVPDPAAAVRTVPDYVPLTPKNPDSESAVKTLSNYNSFRLEGGTDDQLSTQTKLHIISLAEGGQANLSEDKTLNDGDTFYQQIYKPGKNPTIFQAALQNKDNFWGRAPGDIISGLIGLGKDIVFGGADTIKDSFQEINPLATQKEREDAGARKSISIYTGLKNGWDLISNRLWHGAADLISEAGIEVALGVTRDPNQREKFERLESEFIRNGQLRDKQLNDGITNARGDIAGFYRMIGATDRAKQIMSDGSIPTQAQQAFATMVTDPTNIVTEGVGKLAGTMVKAGVRTTGLVDAAAALSEADKNVVSLSTKRAALEATVANTTDDAIRKEAQTTLGHLQPQEQQAQAILERAQQTHKIAEDVVKAQMDEMAKPGIIRGVTAQGFGLLSRISDATAGTIEKGSVLADRMLMRVVGEGSDEEAKAAAKKLAQGFVDHALGISGGTVGAILGGGFASVVTGPVGYGLGQVISKGLREFATNPVLLRNFARDFKTVDAQLSLAQETLPFWKRYAENTKGLTSLIASKLDNQAVYAIPDLARGAAAGAVTGTVLGAMQSGGDPQATVQGFGTGGFFGMAGAGVGQIGKFRSEGELHAARIGDRARFANSLSPADLPHFNQLKPQEQLMLGVFARAHPDLKITFTNDPKAPNGQHFVGDHGGVIQVNVARDNPLQAVLTHEIAHHIAMHDLGPAAARYLIGDPLTGERGIFTKLDEHGQPIIDKDLVTGITSYVPDERFLDYGQRYNARKARDLPNEPPEGMYGIAQEMFAELHAAHFTDPAMVQKMVRGFVPSDLVGPNTMKNWFGKLGLAYDGTSGNPMLNADQANARGAINLVNRYYKERQFRAHPLEHEDGMTKATPDVWRADKSVLENNLDGAGILSRDKVTGEIQRDTAGLPIIKSQKEVDADMGKFTDSLINALQASPHLAQGGSGNDVVGGLVTDRPSKPGGKGREVYRYQKMSQEIIDKIAATNDHNPIQIQNLTKLNGVTGENSGKAVLATYNTASAKGGKYATVEMKQRALVPLYIEVSPGTRQVNIQHYDPETMTANAIKMLKRKIGKELWDGQLGAAMADINTYLTNLATGKPGETGIGLKKKGVINELFGVNMDANPYMTDVVKRSPSVFKTFRLDRLNRIREIAGEPSAARAGTYELVRGFAQPRTAEVVAQDTTAIPVTYRTTSTGKEESVKIGSDIAHAPLIADKAPPETMPKDAPNDFGHLDFMSKPDQQKLTHLNEQSAVTTYADKLVDEYSKWTKDRRVMGAKTWYRDVRKYLTRAVGGDAELFAQLLSATSPGQGVVQNWKDAQIAYERYKAGHYASAIAEFQKTGKITEGMKPKKESGAKFGKNSDAVLKVLAGTWEDTVGGPKTPNFMDNLFGRGTRATIDLWADRTMRRLGYEGVPGAPEQWRIQPESKKGVSNLDFGFSQEAFGEAAKRLGMDAHELQAVLWYAEKVHWATKGHTKGGASAALASYIPQLKAYAAEKSAARKTTPALAGASP